MNIKILSLLFGAILLSFNNSNAQPFLESGNKWIYEYNDATIGGGHFTQSIDSIVILYDTTINGKTYSKLEISNWPPCGNGWGFYLREEGEKIFLLNPFQGYETLIIDFEESESYTIVYSDWVTGDTMHAQAIVDSFGVEELPRGDKLEVQYLHILNNGTTDDNSVYKVLKGVGFTGWNGLLFPNLGTGLCDFPQWVELRCYISNHDTIHFKDFDCYDSSIPMSIYDLNKDLNIAIFPNPAYEYVIIPEGFNVETIFNLSGQIMSASMVGDQFFLCDLRPGMYYIILQGIKSRNLYMSKIIKL